MRNKIYDPYKTEILDLLSSLDIEISNLTQTALESSDNKEEKSKISSAAKENKDFSKYFIFVAAVAMIVTVSYFAGRESVKDDIKIKVFNDSETSSYSETSEIFTGESNSTTYQSRENSSEPEASSYSETSEIFTEESSSTTYQSTENSSEPETSSYSETSEIFTGESSSTTYQSRENSSEPETSSYSETTKVFSTENSVDKNNFFIKNFFSDCDDNRYIDGKGFDVSGHVAVNDYSITICGKELKINKENGKSIWKYEERYSGDYIKNDDNTIILKTKTNKIEEIKFYIEDEKVYMILD